jgi:hypothetical protein
LADLILEPYAVNQRWRFGTTDMSHGALITEYLESIARACNNAGECVVGHIKALALFPGGNFLRVSVVSPSLPADQEGDVPSGCTDLDLALNVIVYGLERAMLERIVHATAVDLTRRWKGEVEIHGTSL